MEKVLKQLRLYMADFDRSTGKISYSIEDTNGDRVDFAEYSDASLKDYDFKVMDLFLLSYLPKLMLSGNSLMVKGPISRTLSNNIMLFQEKLIKSRMGRFSNVNIFFEKIERTTPIEYDMERMKDVTMTYLKNESLDDALASVFKLYQ